MVLLKIGSRFEIEVTGVGSVFIRCGKWERFYNRQGLPSH